MKRFFTEVIPWGCAAVLAVVLSFDARADFPASPAASVSAVPYMGSSQSGVVIWRDSWAGVCQDWATRAGLEVEIVGEPNSGVTSADPLGGTQYCQLSNHQWGQYGPNGSAWTCPPTVSGSSQPFSWDGVDPNQWTLTNVSSSSATCTPVVANVCPANATLQGGNTCSCNQGYQQIGEGEGATCAASPPPCVAGSAAGSGLYQGTDGSPSPANVACDGSCEISFSGSMTNRYLSGGSYVYVWSGSWTKSGGTCAAGDSRGTLASIPADTCGAGQVMGELNGKTICVNSSTGQTVNPNTSVTSSDSTVSTVTNPDGSTTTTTTTTNSNGSSTTTTVNKDTSGNVTGTSTVSTGDDPLKSFCSENPKAPVCSDKNSSWSGTCSAFTCEGDALQCAIAREIHQRNCTLFDAATAQSDLANAVISGADPQAASMPWDASQITTRSLSGSISQDSWMSGTVSDKVISVGSLSFTIPFSAWLPILDILGSILVAVSLLAAARIVGVWG